LQGMMILMLKRVMLGVMALALVSVVIVVAISFRETPAVQMPQPTAEFAPLRIADTITRSETLGRGWVNDLDWSGDTLAVATSVGVWLYDADDLNAAPRLLAGHTGPVSSVDFSADGSRLVSGSWDKTVRVWDVAAGTQQALLEGHEGQVESVAFGPDGNTVVSGGFDTSVREWDIASSSARAVLAGHQNVVTSVAFSPDGRYVASGSRFDEQMIVLWDAASGDQVAVLQGLSNFEIDHLAFSPDSKLLGATASDGVLRLWDTETHQPGSTFVGGSDLAFHGSLIAAGGESLHVWDSATETEHTPLATEAVSRLAFSPDGERVALLNAADDLEIWNLTSSTEVASLTGWHGGAVNAVAFNPDGTTLVSGGGDAFGSMGGVRLWNIDSGVQLANLTADNGPVQTMAVSPDGVTIAVGTTTGVLEFRDGADGLVTRSIHSHDGRVLSLVFSPQGDAVATGGDDASARLWDTSTGEERAELTGLGGPIRHLNMSDEGSLLPSEGLQDVTELAGMEEYNLACTAGAADGVTSMLFSPDKRFVASGYFDNTVKLVDLATGGERFVLRGHTGNVWSIAFSPDSRIMATASADHSIRLWDVKTGEELAVLEGHTWDVNSVAFSPDGTTLAAGSADGTISLWQVAPENTQA
jgi:WD40 repeat protein